MLIFLAYIFKISVKALHFLECNASMYIRLCFTYSMISINYHALSSQMDSVVTSNYFCLQCELYHWADVLDIFDDILDGACSREKSATEGASDEHRWGLSCDLEGNEREKELLLQVLQFTALLIEHSFTRHLYSSMEHLTTLLASSDMTTVLAVLNLLYVFRLVAFHPRYNNNNI